LLATLITLAQKIYEITGKLVLAESVLRAHVAIKWISYSMANTAVRN